MNYRIHSHRYAEAILNTDPEFSDIWIEVQNILQSITDQQIIEQFISKGNNRGKSISNSINELLKRLFVQLG